MTARGRSPRTILSMATDLEIKPLTPERLPDLAGLFEQGGDPKWCWCAYFRVRGISFSGASKTRHRTILETATREGDAEGRAPGLVAYAGDEAVGWISIGPRDDYERLAHSTVLAPVDDTPVWSIVCFVVGRQARGRGIARALLDAGVAFAREHGARMLEAYPTDVPKGKRIPSAEVYRGTLTMFERAGFKIVAWRTGPGAATPRPIVRRATRRSSTPRSGADQDRSSSRRNASDAAVNSRAPSRPRPPGGKGNGARPGRP
jgi:GNAT superfamily N-acetyltransferase